MDSEYPELMRRLAGVQARYADERQQARQRYETQRAAAAMLTDEARSTVAKTAAGIRAANSVVEHVDTEAAEIWYALRNRTRGRLRARLGVPPEPAPADQVVEPDAPPAMAAGDGPPDPPAVQYLHLAAEVVAKGRRHQPLPVRSYGLLPVLGGLGAALAFAIARAILLLGHVWHGPVSIVLVAVGQIAVFSSPLAGLPAAKIYADRRASRLDGGAIALVVLGGVVMVCGLNLLR